MVTTSDAEPVLDIPAYAFAEAMLTHVNVTINGIPYSDSESQGTFWVDIPDIASSTQSISDPTRRGHLTNGGSAFGATVNLQTNSLQADPYAEIMIGGGSFNTRRSTLRAGTGRINNHWAFDARCPVLLPMDDIWSGPRQTSVPTTSAAGTMAKTRLSRQSLLAGTKKLTNPGMGWILPPYGPIAAMNFAGAITSGWNHCQVLR